MLGSAELDTLLAKEPPRTRDVYNILSQLHRQMRAEHMQLLYRFSRSGQSMMRLEALEQMKVLGWYTDQHRDLVADAVLTWSNVELQAPIEEKPLPPVADVALPEKAGGLPVRLSEVLRRIFLAEQKDELLWGLRTWARRWTFDEVASSEDRRLLLEMVESGEPAAIEIAAHAMRNLRDPATAEALLDLLDHGSSTYTSLFALGALAARGHAAQVEALREAAESDAEHLGMWLSVTGATGIDATCEIATGADYARGLEWIERLGEAIEEGYRTGLLVPAELGRRLEQAAFEAKLDPTRIEALLQHFPACHTRRLIGRYMATFAAEHLETLPVALCAAADANTLRERLREFHDDEDEETRHRAIELSLQVGDPESAETILAWYIAEEHDEWLDLARTRHPAIRQWLVELAQRNDDEITHDEMVGSIVAIAALDGLDEAVASGWYGDISHGERIEETDSAWRRLVLAGKPVEALVAYLDGDVGRSTCFSNLGLVDDPRIRAHLTALRHRADYALRYEVIGQLALNGDLGARAEIQAACKDGRYGWLDNAHDRVLTLGYDAATLPFWVSELESNCCRNVIAEGVFDHMLGFDIHDIQDGAPVTRLEVVGALVEEFGQHLQWSPIAGRHVIVLP